MLIKNIAQKLLAECQEFQCASLPIREHLRYFRGCCLTCEKFGTEGKSTSEEKSFLGDRSIASNGIELTS